MSFDFSGGSGSYSASFGDPAFSLRMPATIPSFNSSDTPDVGGGAIPATRIPESSTDDVSSAVSQLKVGLLQTLLDVIKGNVLPKQTTTNPPPKNTPGPSKAPGNVPPTFTITGKGASVWPYVAVAAIIGGVIVYAWRART